MYRLQIKDNNVIQRTTTAYITHSWLIKQKVAQTVETLKERTSRSEKCGFFAHSESYSLAKESQFESDHTRKCPLFQENNWVIKGESVHSRTVNESFCV